MTADKKAFEMKIASMTKYNMQSNTRSQLVTHIKKHVELLSDLGINKKDIKTTCECGTLEILANIYSIIQFTNKKIAEKTA